MPFFRRQRRLPSALRARLQPWQLHANAGDAEGSGAWSLTSLREKLIKIGAKVVSHGRYATFQLAEVVVSRQMFEHILMLIARLRAPPAPAGRRRERCVHEAMGEVCVDEHKRSAFAVPLPSAVGFDRLLLAVRAIHG
jgi:hypothetical protein